MNKVCRTCGELKSTEDFVIEKKVKSGRGTQCKACKNKDNRKWYAENPEKKKKYGKSDTRKNYVYKRLYGITLQEYRKLYEAQNGGCFICGKHEQTLYVDHCHKNGDVRGLLCVKCNSALGFVNDNISILEKMINYLLGR